MKPEPRIARTVPEQDGTLDPSHSRQPLNRSEEATTISTRSGGDPAKTPSATIDAAPETAFQHRSRVTHFVAAALLLALGLLFVASSLDVKHESNIRPVGPQDYVADEVIADLKDSVSDADVAALNEQLGIELRYNSPHARAHKLMVAKVLPERNAMVVAALRASPLVEAADPNYLRQEFSSTWTPNDPYYPQQWHLKMLRLEEAWVYTKGKGAVVAVVDSGVGSDGPQVSRTLSDFGSTIFVPGYDFVEKDTVAQDQRGHGSHVAGTIAESTDNGVMGAGVAPEASIMPVRVMNAAGRGTDADIADGLRFAVDHGAHIINLSLGGPSSGSVLQLACQYAKKKGVTLVCAAGNDGRAGVSTPARWPECIAVSAVGPDRQLAPYSNRGPEIDIAGPGGNLRGGAANGIWQNTLQRQKGSLLSRPGLVEGFYALEGTSMAAPHVAGVAALLVSAGVRDPDQVRAVLRRSATTMGEADRFGAGLVDAAAALAATGRSPYEQYYPWIALAVAAIVLVAVVGFDWLWRALICLAVGYLLPDAVERLVGFGSVANLLGHSVLAPLVWLLLGPASSASNVATASLTVGLVVHFGLDAHVGAASPPVSPTSRLLFWYCLNLGLLTHLLLLGGLRGSGAHRSHCSASRNPALA